MSILEEVRTFLGGVTGNVLTANAYDTAWVAALPATPHRDQPADPHFPASLEWLRSHQHLDGSWGAPWPYYHDRLLSTLRAVLTLHTGSARTADQPQIRRGLGYLWRNADRLRLDPWETVGFELIFPTLLAEAEHQGLDLPYAAFSPVQELRAAKLAKASLDLAYLRTLPLAVSLEGLGPAFDPARAQDVQECNGAVGMSPAATAYLLQYWPDNAAAWQYLEEVGTGDGGVPHFAPMETMELSWALYYLQHAVPDLYRTMDAETLPILRFLDRTVRTSGWTFSEYVTCKEADTTAVCFAVLRRAGYPLDPQLLYQYEEATHFRCYPFERNPSISANVHILDALHYCDPEERAPRVAKILRFLRAARQPGGFWFDKWHVSPYYTTSHAVQAAHDFAPDLVQPAITWLIHSQDDQGAWGFYAPTIEETAYAMQALLTWRAAGHPAPTGVLARGAAYLREHWDPAMTDYPPLWIAKTLFVSVQAVRAAILAALVRCEASL